MTTGSGRPISRLERELGAHASGYLLAPFTIEEADEELLDHFLSTVTNDRLVKIWRKKTASSGRLFIKLMSEEIQEEEMSMTGENTIQAKIDVIVRSGLTEATMHNLYYMMEVYEEWANALPLDAQVTDSKKAYIYQKWVCDLSPAIKMQMQLNLASLESKAAAKGKDIRATDPIGLVTKAANIVLSDEANEATIKGIETGHAFFTSKFDPRKRPPAAPGGGGGGGGTTPTTGERPKVWIAGMRLCAMCPQGTSDKAREHMDKSCRHATPAKLAEHAAAIESKRAARKAEWEKSKSKSGSAKIVEGTTPTGAIDETDAEMSNLFEANSPTQIDLSELLGQSTNARSLMARANTLSEASTTPAASTVSPSVSGDSESGTRGNIYIVGNTGDDTEDTISAGIYVGAWSNASPSSKSPSVISFINNSYLENQLVLDPKALKARTKTASGLETAVARCTRLGIVPTYMGPVELTGLSIGDNVGVYLQKANPQADEDSSEPEACTSDDEPEPDDEETTTSERHAKADAADLLNSQPPKQPASHASKFDQDLGNVANATGPHRRRHR